MGLLTNIQWTDISYNVAVGCKKKDTDCKNCYMFRDSLNGTRYNPKVVRQTKTVFDLPLRIKQKKSNCWDGPPLVFTCSLTDFFIKDIDPYRHEVWDMIRQRPDLIFQILTKEPERINDHLPPDWGEGWDNVWLGTSVGGPQGIMRIIDLLQVKCKTRFLSIEPYHKPYDLRNLQYHSLYSDTNIKPVWGNEVSVDCLTGQAAHGKVGYNCNKLHWVIVGGESGNDNGLSRYRPCKLAWIEKVVQDCKETGVPVFVKQLGTHLSKELKMSDRHGGNINEFPAHLQVRQFPVI